MAKYGEKASSKVEKAMHERKRGTLKSGRSGKTVKSRKQAIAIGLSEARKAGAKVPAKKKSSAKTARKPSAKKAVAKKSHATKSSPRKSTARKSTARKSSGGKSSGKKSVRKAAKSSKSTKRK